jgi:hypothetical protein
MFVELNDIYIWEDATQRPLYSISNFVAAETIAFMDM